MKQNSSSRRLNEQAREIVANILLFEFNDPRLRSVTITGCEVSFDRGYCNVFYSTNAQNYDDAACAFKSAGGRIRFLMGKQLSWRVTPELRFILDTGADRAEAISVALQKEALRNEENAHGAIGEEA